MPIGALDEDADDGSGVSGLLPGDHAEDAGLHGEIENGDADNRDENCAGNISLPGSFISPPRLQTL